MGRYVSKHLMPGEKVAFETRLSAWCYISMRSLLSLGLIPFIQRRTREYAVTNKRVIIKSGLIRVNSLELNLSKVESVAVVPGSAAQDRSPRELDLRAKTGATLIAIRRGTDVRPVTGPGEPLREGDVAYFIGEAEAVRAAVQLLSAPPGAAESAAS